MFENILNVNGMELLDVTLRAFISLITLFLITKMLGKRQVSQLSLFDYVIGISIGNFAAEMTINLESDYLHGILAVVIFGFVAYFVSILTMKSIHLRRYFMGVPTILIQDGKVLEKNMKKIKYDMNDLLEQCSINGYFDLSEIKYALMEANGTLSILPFEKERPLKVKDMNINPKMEGLCANVVIDGKIMKNNLKNCNKTEEWLQKELKLRGYIHLDDILLVTLDVNEKLQIYEKNLNETIKNVLE